MLLVANGFIEAPVMTLYQRHNRALFNFVAWLCQGNLAEAEDIAQRTWVTLMTRCGDYRPEAAFRTFLFQIARNAWLDGRKSAWESRREALAEDVPDAEAPDLPPEAELALRQDARRTRAALLELPHPQREAVVLRYFADMSLDEIAQTVGVGLETVKSRLRYAYASLRRALEPGR